MRVTPLRTCITCDDRAALTIGLGPAASTVLLHVTGTIRAAMIAPASAVRRFICPLYEKEVTQGAARGEYESGSVAPP